MLAMAHWEEKEVSLGVVTVPETRQSGSAKRTSVSAGKLGGLVGSCVCVYGAKRMLYLA